MTKFGKISDDVEALARKITMKDLKAVREWFVACRHIGEKSNFDDILWLITSILSYSYIPNIVNIYIYNYI